MEKNFQKNEMISIAKEMQKNGKTWKEIAKHLNHRGFTNTYGRPYSEGGIWTMVTLATDPAYRTKTQHVTSSVVLSQKKVLARRKKTIGDLRREIINLNGVDADLKLDLLEKTYGL